MTESPLPSSRWSTRPGRRPRSGAAVVALPADPAQASVGPKPDHSGHAQDLRAQCIATRTGTCVKGRNPDAALPTAAISVRPRQQARSGRTAPHHHSQGGNPSRSPPAYSHAPWSPTAAASSRASAGAPRSFGRVRPCSPSLVRQFRWRSLPRPPRPQPRLRPPPLRPRRTTEALRRTTEVPRQATEPRSQAAPARHSPHRRRRLQRQLNPLPRPEHRRRRPRSPRHRAAA